VCRPEVPAAEKQIAADPMTVSGLMQIEKTVPESRLFALLSREYGMRDIRNTPTAWILVWRQARLGGLLRLGGSLLLLLTILGARNQLPLEELQKVEGELAPVVELLEDNTDFFLEHLNNNGVADASIAEANEQTHFSGVRSLAVTKVQRFNAYIPGWRYQIAENPIPGQFRFIRFAWKRTEAAGIMLQLHAWPNGWEHRYFAGSLSQSTQAWGSMTRIAEDPPRQWELVTRDLFADFGPMTITGIGFSALEGPGHAYFDHIYLGRTVEDLDGVTARLKNVLDPPIEGSSGWLNAALLSGTVILLVAMAWFLFVRRRRIRRIPLPDMQHSDLD
jgi:hypothetical protein